MRTGVVHNVTRAVTWVAVLAVVGAVRAEPPVEHVVRPGETLAAIADQYYGDPRKEGILVAENGLTSEGGSAIVTGLRLRIPTVSYHQVIEGETWASVASHYYGDPQRAFAIIEANGADPSAPPDPGSEIVVPYPLRHVAAQHETVRNLAKDYLSSLKSGMTTIRRFNGFESNRLQRGQIVLVPLANLKLSDKVRAARETAPGGARAEGKVRERQAQVDLELPVLREHVRAGRYVDAVQLANRLGGGGDLSARQVVTIQRELATALVALDREDLALAAFETVLAQQPDYELDGVKTSPTVLRVFDQAKKATVAAGPAVAGPAPAPGSAATPAVAPVAPEDAPVVAPAALDEDAPAEIAPAGDKSKPKTPARRHLAKSRRRR